MHTHLNHPSRRLSYSSSGIDALRVLASLCVRVCPFNSPISFFTNTATPRTYTYLKNKQLFQIGIRDTHNGT